MEFKYYRGKVRRFYISHFKEDYIQERLENRKGQCHKCGRCCSLGYRCMFLTEGNLCSVYIEHRWLRPKQCQTFPLDQKDLDELNYPQCGYRFEN